MFNQGFICEKELPFWNGLWVCLWGMILAILLEVLTLGGAIPEVGNIELYEWEGKLSVYITHMFSLYSNMWKVIFYFKILQP